MIALAFVLGSLWVFALWGTTSTVRAHRTRRETEVFGLAVDGQDVVTWRRGMTRHTFDERGRCLAHRDEDNFGHDEGPGRTCITRMNEDDVRRIEAARETYALMREARKELR